jgi:response regulator RpfG family c-di-GMP phosphodiesterase
MTDVPLFRSRSHTILVIEDDSANRQVLASRLTREHYAVRTAADGESGLTAALVGAFDATPHDRPRRGAHPLAVAMDEIRLGAGRQFDPAFAGAFLEILEAITAKAN